MNWKRTVLALALLGIVGTSAGQEMPTSADEEFLFITRILTYDRNLKTRAGDDLVIGILYQARHTPSDSLKKEFERVVGAFPVERVRGLRVVFLPMNIDHSLPSARVLAQRNVTALYVAPLQGIDVKSVADLCRTTQITSITPVQEYIDQGLAVAIVPDTPRPRIIVNLPAAKQEGADFSSQLLKLATVVH